MRQRSIHIRDDSYRIEINTSHRVDSPNESIVARSISLTRIMETAQAVSGYVNK